jgi:1,6-anhydro-N-acetylmuramate kinase
MSGTSGDGVDSSIVQSDGDIEYKVILDKYFKYSQDIYENIHFLKNKINTSIDLKTLSKEIDSQEKETTICHAKAANKNIKELKSNIDFIGFN